MNKTDTSGPAFPIQDAYAMSTERGMTLRDYFAAKAMQGLVTEIENEMRAARWCYTMADAMLKARDE